MKKTGVILYFLINFCLIIYYSNEVFDYFADKYNFDGFRFIIPVTVSDIFFLVSLLLYYFSAGFSNRFFILLGLVLAHNIAIGFGAKYFPFIALFIALTSIYLILFKPPTKHSN